MCVELEHKVLGKTAAIPLHLFVEALSRDLGESRKIGVHHDFLVAQEADGALDGSEAQPGGPAGDHAGFLLRHAEEVSRRRRLSHPSW